MRRLLTSGVVAALALMGTTAAPAMASTSSSAHPGSSTAVGPRLRADINADGYADLVIGIPGASVGGAAQILFGGPNGLSARGAVILTQDTPGIVGRSVRGDAFGSSLATGHFNGDRYTDLVVGASGNDSINVIYGSATGLTAVGNTMFTPSTTGLRGRVGGFHFGRAMTSGNFGKTAQDDLAIGSPYSSSDRGSVLVLYGTARGLSVPGSQLWTQDSAGIKGVSAPYDEFGAALAAGNFGRSGYADLTIGAPGDSSPKGTITGQRAGVGAVNVLYGSSTGLTSAGNQMWTQNSAGVMGIGQASDNFGQSLAAADLGRSFHVDLAVGVPGNAGFKGAVNVLYGSAAGLTATGNQLWSRQSPGVLGAAQGQFGWSLAAANFGKTAQADLAVGVPWARGVGEVNILYGSATGLSSSGSQVWAKDTPGVAGEPETGDVFGWTMAAGDFGRGRYADLAVTANQYDKDVPHPPVGSVLVVYGSAPGLVAAGSQLWTMPGTDQYQKDFGASLATGYLGTTR